MFIKKRPIITWLLNKNQQPSTDNILISNVSNIQNYQLLNESLINLDNLRKQNFNWGLPELIMSSFIDIMQKSAPSFEKILPALFHEFSKREEQGILLCNNTTFIYRFFRDQLHIWVFEDKKDKSILRFSSVNEFINKDICIRIPSSLIADNILFSGSIDERQHFIASAASFIATYVTVKRFVKVETIVIPQGKFTQLEGTILEYIDKKKVINQTGQEVIVMDSKWFRKIINDNDIYVRGYWRGQNKKNPYGEWYKELIFIEATIRHGYHRNSKIEYSEDCYDNCIIEDSTTSKKKDEENPNSHL